MIDKINNLIISTTKSRNIKDLEVYKLVKAEFQKAIKSGKNWDPTEVLLKMISARKDSISEYTKAGRKDLVAQEEYEIKVIQNLLPPMASEDEMKEAVLEVLKSLPNPGLKDIKEIMGTLKPKYPGLTGGLVSKTVKWYVSNS